MEDWWFAISVPGSGPTAAPALAAVSGQLSGTEDLAAATRRLADGLAEIGATSEIAAPKAAPKDVEQRVRIRQLLKDAHREVMHAIVDGSARSPEVLADLAAVVRDMVPAKVVNPLPIRVRIFVRLLRVGALEPAFTLAGDNAVGVVQEPRSVVRWAGGMRATSPLALPTLVEGGRVFAWLPGFRDPRFEVPDSVYDVVRNVKLAGQLQYLSWADDSLVLAGSAFLSALTACSDDEITVVTSGPERAEHRVRARRMRTPQYVKPRGADLTRLAWAGWQAEVDLAPLAEQPGRHALTLELSQGTVHRSGPLGVRRGPFVESMRRVGPQRVRGHLVGVDSASDGQLSILAIP